MADYRGPQEKSYTQEEFNKLMVRRFELEDSSLHVAGPIEKPSIRNELGVVGRRELEEFRKRGL